MRPSPYWNRSPILQIICAIVVSLQTPYHPKLIVGKKPRGRPLLWYHFPFFAVLERVKQSVYR